MARFKKKIRNLIIRSVEGSKKEFEINRCSHSTLLKFLIRSNNWPTYESL